MDNYICDHADWDLIPDVIKKRVAARRNYYAQKTQGTHCFSNGFSFDSDYTDKLYNF